MNYPSPRHWLLLDAICRSHSLSLAADQLAMSQPAASQALKELEQRLGQSLFLRQNRQLVPTQHTLDLIPKLRQWLELQQQLVQPNPSQGELRLVASETIGCYLLPPLLAKFAGVRVKLQICNSSEVLQQLRQQQAQLGFIEGPVLSDEFEVRPWRQDHLVLISAPEYPLVDTSAATLQQQCWIIRERGSGTRAVLEHELARHGWTLTRLLELQRPEAIKQAVKHGLGIGCLPWLSVQDDVKRGEFQALPHPLQLQRQLSVLLQIGPQSGLVQQFTEFFSNEQNF